MVLADLVQLGEDTQLHLPTPSMVLTSLLWRTESTSGHHSWQPKLACPYWHYDIAVTKKVNHSLAFLMRNLPLKIKAVLRDTGQTHHGVCQFTMKLPHQDQRPTARHCPATGHMIHGWGVPIWEWHNDQWLYTPTVALPTTGQPRQ